MVRIFMLNFAIAYTLYDALRHAGAPMMMQNYKK